MELVYLEGVIPAGRRVTYNVPSLTVGDAFKQLLQNTGARAVIAAGKVSIVRGSTQRAVVQGVITGKVTDVKTGRPVSGANVTVGSEVRGITTGEDGLYRLAGIAPGVHTVTVRLVGYARQSRSVTLGEGATVTADFKLEPSANVLDQVVVIGTIVSTELKAVPNAITVITAKQIEERGVTRIDQLFRGDIPGLFSMNRGSNAMLDEVTMFSRGATALSTTSGSVDFGTGSTGALTNPIKTYIDGVEMVDPRYMSQIDPKSIERIEILTGPQASTIYGSNALNGVMQIFTKRGNTAKPRITLNYVGGIIQNNFDSHLAPTHSASATVSGTEGRLSYNVGGAWDYTGAWTPGKRTQRLSANGGGRMDLGKVTFDLSARHGTTRNKQRGSSGQGERELRATGVWSYSDFSALLYPTIQSLDAKTLGLTMNYRPQSWWSHELVVGTDAPTVESRRIAPGYREGVGAPSDTLLNITYSTTSRRSERYTTTVHLPIAAFSQIDMTLGGDHWRTEAYSWEANPLSLSGNLANVTNLRRSKPAKNSGAFVQSQISFADALFFTYGLRAEWNPNYGDKARVLPGRYGVSYSRDIASSPFGPLSAKLRGSYGRATRPPTEGLKLAVKATQQVTIDQFGQYDGTLANPDLLPEHQQGGEGGMELYFSNRGSLVITRYNQTVDNLISIVTGADSVRSLTGTPTSSLCSSTFRNDDGYCFRYQTQYLNVGSIRNQGWELQGSVNTGSFTTRGTYSWTKSRVIGVTPRYRALLTRSEFQAGNSFNFLPEHTWAVGVTYAAPSSTVSLSVNGTGMLYRQFDELGLASSASSRLIATRPRLQLTTSMYRPRGAGYATADLNATHQLSSRFDVHFQITNLTNFYQNDYRADNAAIGRQTRLGVRLH